MATVPLSKILANFETSLATRMSSSATTLTLTSSTDPDGSTLSGNYLLTIDEGTNAEEHMIVTLAGTSGSSARRGLSRVNGYTEVSGNKFEHRRGATVKITDFALVQINRLLNGDDTFGGVSWAGITSITGLSTPTSGETTKAANVGYVNDVALAGAPDASTSSKGVVEIATDAEVAAGTSTGGTGAILAAPASSHTQTAAATKVPVSKSNSKLDDGWIGLTTAGDTVYSDGTDLTRLALGALNTVLKAGASAPSWGTVAPTELTGVSANVSAANLNTLTAGVASNASSLHIHGIGFGSGTKTGASGTGTQDIAHGLGVAPRFFFIIAHCPNSFSGAQFARTSYGMASSTSNEICIAHSIRTTTAVGGGSNSYSGSIVMLEDDGSTPRFTAAVSAIDATNVTLNWSAVPASGEAGYIWFALA